MEYWAKEVRTGLGITPNPGVPDVPPHYRCAHCVEELGRDNVIEVEEVHGKELTFWLHKSCAGYLLTRASKARKAPDQW